MKKHVYDIRDIYAGDTTGNAKGVRASISLELHLCIYATNQQDARMRSSFFLPSFGNTPSFYPDVHCTLDVLTFYVQWPHTCRTERGGSGCRERG